MPDKDGLVDLVERMAIIAPAASIEDSFPQAILKLILPISLDYRVHSKPQPTFNNNRFGTIVHQIFAMKLHKSVEKVISRDTPAYNGHLKMEAK